MISNLEVSRNQTMSNSKEAKDDNPDLSDGESNKDSSPQPVSSDDDEVSSHNMDQTRSKSTGSSRFFAPYRTVGLVNSGSGFHLLPNQNSAQAFAVCPIGDRFQLLQTDRLHPVLVSHAVTTAKKSKSERRIHDVVSDASLSITVTSHGPAETDDADTVTLFQRARPITSRQIVPNKKWRIEELISMGRIKREVKDNVEKEGVRENVAIVVALLSRKEDDIDDTVPIIGNDNDSSSDDDDDDDDDSYSEDDGNQVQIVVLMASRTSLYIHKRLSLPNLPNFQPTTISHPATYLNKVIIGGSDNDKTALILLNIRSGKVIHRFRCLPSSSGAVTALEQAPAVDTFAVGTSLGKVHLINLKHDKSLFSLNHKGKKGNTAITSISFRTDGSAMHYGISPMAVGRSDGTITVWDLTPPEDEDMGRTILCELENIHQGGVAKLQYFPQEPLLISSGKSSNSMIMHIFDNPDHTGRILRQRKGHTAPPCRIQYLHGGAGAGNGVLVNMSDGTDASACQILSSGGPDRTLRVFSTARTVLDKEYSQGKGLEKYAKKIGLADKTELLLPPLTAMATSEVRSRDWGDLVTIHQDHSFAYVWSTKRGAQSGPVLRQQSWNVSAMKKPPPSDTHATSITMSACGNFALVGTKGGTIFRYNVQSGIPRGSFPPNADTIEKPTKSQAIGNVERTKRLMDKKLKIKSKKANLDKSMLDAEQAAKKEEQLLSKLQVASHQGYSVTGLAVDILNKTLISVGADSKLILWNFQSQAPHKKSPFLLPCAATMVKYVRESDLAAIALNDYSVVLFDCSTQSVVRRFGKGIACHKDAITDLDFSPDGRTLYSSSLDSTIRLWDVPTNTCVDWLGFKAPPSSLTISPTGEYLATTHAGKLGICIWSDKSYFETVNVDGILISEPAKMDEPMPAGVDLSDTISNDIKFVNMKDVTKSEKDNSDDVNSGQAAIPKEEGLFTLSGFPAAHWKNLFHLELVKERNKPKEPPKKPPNAPFFLQWRSAEPNTDDDQREVKEKPDEEDEWEAAWSDDANDVKDDTESQSEIGLKRNSSSSDSPLPATTTKKRKVTHHRSHLASILVECSEGTVPAGTPRFQRATDYVATLGPSAIDVALSTLCNGMHDLDDGLNFLFLTCRWLLEACKSRERFDAVNAYLHRFLSLQAFVIAGIKTVVSNSDERNEEIPTDKREEYLELIRLVDNLKGVLQTNTERLQGKMEQSLCLLRHFSRMI